MQHEPNTYTVGRLVCDFLEYAEEEYRSGHHKNLRSTLEKLRAHSGGMPAAEFRGAALRAFRTALVNGELSETVLSRQYINRVVKHVRQAFTWAVSMDRVPPDTAQVLATVPALRAGRTAAPETEPIEPVDTERILAVVAHLPEPIRSIVELLRLTGARTCEIRRMVQGDIDMTRDDVWVLVPRAHKTAHLGKARMIPLDEPCQRLLVPWMRPFLPDAPVFPSPKTGRFLGKSTVYNAVQRACREAGVEPFHPHQIRHRVLTDVRQRSGGDLEIAQAVAGHSSRATTERYADIGMTAWLRGIELLRGAGAS